jgi:nanoRNase/pAp phosphatase (c-di-AMP/oligoRNAs hydrolase)
MPGTFYAETSILQRETRGKNVLVLSHTRPDLDTLASASVLAYILGKQTPSTWGLCEKLNDTYSQRVSSFTVRPQVITTLEKFDCVVCVDFRSPAQAGELSSALQSFSGKIIILDHHHPSSSEFSGKIIKLIHPGSAATAQLVATVARELNVELPKPLAAALAMAIITDSAKFAVANNETFSTFAFLLEKSGQSYEQLLERSIPPLELGDTVASFHALRQARLLSVGKYLLASTSAPYHNARAANALIQMGADVALGVFPGKEGLFCAVRISGRAHSVLQLDAMKILPVLAREHNGTCGGHARAAQLNLPPYLSENIIIDAFTRELQRHVRKIDKKSSVKIY